MKTAKEIKDVIEKEKEEERVSNVERAIDLIEAASEKMFTHRRQIERIEVNDKNYNSFILALKQPEVVQCLETTGFTVEVNEVEMKFFLKF